VHSRLEGELKTLKKTKKDNKHLFKLKQAKKDANALNTTFLYYKYREASYIRLNYLKARDKLYLIL
jgi:hypothetical protein